MNQKAVNSFKAFPKGISSGSVKAIIFIILVGATLGFWLYTRSIFNQVRQFQHAVVKTQVQIYLHIIDPRVQFEGGIDDKLFDTVVKDAPYPTIFTDPENNPEFWHNVGIQQEDTTAASHQKLLKMIAEMDKVNPPEQVIYSQPEITTENLTVFDIPSLKQLPFAITAKNGNILYSRNLYIQPGDTAKQAIEKLDSVRNPLKFTKDNEPEITLHGLDDNWEIVVVKGDNTPIFWHGVNYQDGVPLKSLINLADANKNYIKAQKETTKDVLLLVLHYGDLPFLSLIGWLPIAEFGVIFILLFIGFMGFKTIKNAEQRSIWVGMAKETAHQLGTPISSLNGWLELMKEQDKDIIEQALPEMEYDVKRLTRVAERFSNVGSRPELKPIEILDVIEEVLDYYRIRAPRMGKRLTLESNLQSLRRIMGNRELLNWAFENLIKNALYAIETSEGKISVNGSMSKDFRTVILDFKDNGKGIHPSDQKKIMKPGFTTKKRGWGLGLSLVKRIVEEYHGGKVFLLDSKPGVGTIIRVILPAEKV